MTFPLALNCREGVEIFQMLNSVITGRNYAEIYSDIIICLSFFLDCYGEFSLEQGKAREAGMSWEQMPSNLPSLRSSLKQ